jgi:hypothetical protein
MNLEHKSLGTWKNEFLLMVACHSDQFYVFFGCYSEQFRGYLRKV